jgi:hypothetical protein
VPLSEVTTNHDLRVESLSCFVATGRPVGGSRDAREMPGAGTACRDRPPSRSYNNFRREQAFCNAPVWVHRKNADPESIGLFIVAS